jgi:MFS family permease
VRLLDRNVLSLGAVSFVADLSSELVYPIFPLFVTLVLGAPVAVLGLIEGVAEATASLSRYPFGRWSDTAAARRPFVLLGYGLSALGKLLLALALVWPVALAARFVDRAGKGMRTAPRDALLAARVHDRDRGLAFGLHRSLDTLGAVLGPLVALALLHAGVSGALSVLVIVKFVRVPHSPAFRWLLVGSLVFAAGNSTNTFILLKASSVGFGYTGVILVYVLYNLTYAGGSLPLGSLSDRIGQFPVVIGGFVVFAVVYAGFAAAKSAALVAVLFAAYGLYIAATEGTSKALISRAAPDEERASAMGFYDTAVGVATFVASTLGGILWSTVGPWATFAYGAACAAVAATIMLSARGGVARAGANGSRA